MKTTWLVVAAIFALIVGFFVGYYGEKPNAELPAGVVKRLEDAEKLHFATPVNQVEQAEDKLYLYVDSYTGCHYIRPSTSNSVALTPRMYPNGTQVCDDK